MSRYCSVCERIQDFFRLRKSKTVLYCSICCRPIEVTEREADWFQYDVVNPQN